MVTERQRAEAVRQILLQLYSLVDAGMPKSQIRRVVREAIFFLYEGGEAAKWASDRPHSMTARELSLGKKIYDHAIPLASLLCKLKKASASPESFHAFLIRYVQGVVITKEEDRRLTSAGLRSRMPSNADPDDKMARYSNVGIAFAPADEAKLRKVSS